MGAADLLAHVRAAGFTLDLADGKLLVTPASMLTDDLRAALRASKPEVLALLEGEHAADAAAYEERAAIMKFEGGLSRADAEVAARQCVDCEHFGRRGTCGEPVAAGLLTTEEGFGIVWPPEGYGVGCPAFIGKMPTAAADRPHRQTNDEADRCHAPCRDDAEIEAFTARTERFALLGRADADDLAERLTLRDRDADDRRLCLECTWLGDTGRCLAAATGRIPGADRRLEPVQTIFQRCGAFGLRKGLV